MPRSKLDILAEVLEIARNETTKTRIVGAANLNQKIATYSLNLLVDLDLVTERHNSPLSYHITEKGLGFLNEYRRLQKILNTKNNEKETRQL
jgi:predicted transcriptional regulator